MNKEELIKEMCESKARESNTIDLTTYAVGLGEMYDRLTAENKRPVDVMFEQLAEDADTDIIGRWAKVIKCIHGHEFEFGEKVLIGAISEDEYFYQCKNKQGVEWYLTKDEFELL